MTKHATDLRARLEALPPAVRARLAWVGEAAARAGLPAYLVGGPVRDLLLGRRLTDLDFVVVPRAVGDPPPAPGLARALAHAHGGEVTTHGTFGTATWRDPLGAALDLATARTETYAFPGALPTVTPADDIATDLRRRDFTINALALRVDGDHRGELVDAHGGQHDLAAGLIRVLHPLSFQDDPTRLFRAVRYAERLGFRLTPDTADAIGPALDVIPALSGERVRHELELIFREPEPGAALARLEDLGALASVHRTLKWDASAAANSSVIQTLPRPDWQLPGPLDVDSLYLALLLRGAADEHSALLAGLDRLAVTRAVADAVTGALQLRLNAERPSEVVTALEGLGLTAVAAAYVAWPAARDRLDAYLSRWRHIRAKITGDDLLAWGLPPGPDFKRILARLRAARLDGEITDDAGEQALARALAGLE